MSGSDHPAQSGTDDSRQQPDVADVIPAWNERENIELLLPALKDLIADLGLTAEIVVADGGSRDGTAEAAPYRRKFVRGKTFISWGALRGEFKEIAMRNGMISRMAAPWIHRRLNDEGRRNRP